MQRQTVTRYDQEDQGGSHNCIPFSYNRRRSGAVPTAVLIVLHCICSVVVGLSLFNICSDNHRMGVITKKGSILCGSKMHSNESIVTYISMGSAVKSVELEPFPFLRPPLFESVCK